MTNPPVVIPAYKFACTVFLDVTFDVLADLSATTEGLDPGQTDMIRETADAGEYSMAMQMLYATVVSHPAISGGGALLWWKVDLLDWLWSSLVPDMEKPPPPARFNDRDTGGVVKNPPLYYTYCLPVVGSDSQPRPLGS